MNVVIIGLGYVGLPLAQEAVRGMKEFLLAFRNQEEFHVCCRVSFRR